MSVRALAVVLLAGLSACAPEEDRVCQRLLAADGGLTSRRWAVAGETVSATLTSPLAPCVSDPLRVEARLFDPDNAEVPVRVAGEPTRSGVLSAATASLEFTPAKPGTYVLQVSFEPSLGARTLLVDAAGEGAALPVVRVPRPAACDRPWAIADDAVLCEAFDAGLTLISADGGTTTFDGQELVVAGDVAWSVSRGVLERRRFVDGGLELTHALPGFVQGPTKAVQGDTVALRNSAAGHLERVALTDAGVTRQIVGQPTSPHETRLYFMDPSLESTDAPQFLALEPEVRWSSRLERRDLLVAFRRPTNWSQSPLFEVEGDAQPPRVPAHAVERLPLWLQLELGGERALLVEARDGLLHATAWRRDEVLVVGRSHLLVRDEDPAWFRVYRK